MKYRSAFAGICVAALSVFLFTACEKDSDGDGPAKPDRISKFERLTFSSGSSSTSTSSTSSGTFTGGGGNISYAPPGSGTEGTFTSADPEGPAFTDPQSTGNSFDIRGASFGQGGGTITIDGETTDLAYAFCANTDLFDLFDFDGDDGDNEDLNIFIGIGGDLDLSQIESGGDSSENPIDLLVYVFSYGGGSDIGDFGDFEDGEDLDGVAFILVVTFDDNGDGDFKCYNENNI